LEYTLRQLEGARDILSVGCGPAIIEAGLAERGFNVTGLDISEGALGQAPDSLRTVVGSADNMSFADSSFDAVIYIASLQLQIPLLMQLSTLPLCSLLNDTRKLSNRQLVCSGQVGNS